MRRESASERARSRRSRRRTLREDAQSAEHSDDGQNLAIPLVLVLLDRGGPRDCFWAALLFAGAAITDFLDGYLAQRSLVSVLGKFLDPSPTSSFMATLGGGVPMAHRAMGRRALARAEISITGLRSIAASGGVVIEAGEVARRERCRWSVSSC